MNLDPDLDQPDFKQMDRDYELLSGPKADAFTLALDRMGWKIVMNRPLDPGEMLRRWSLNDPCDDCPDFRTTSNLCRSNSANRNDDR